MILSNALITPNIGLMFWTLLSFFLLLFILSKFAWKPIMAGIKAREQSIAKALSEARLAREEMKSLNAENEKLLGEARMERDKILKEAREIKDRLVNDAKTQAQEEARIIVANARESIEKEKNAAFNELKEQVVNLAIEAASKILKKELSTESGQEELIEDYLKETNVN